MRKTQVLIIGMAIQKRDPRSELETILKETDYGQGCNR